MVFESPTGFEQHRKVQLAIAVVLLILLLGFVFHRKLTTWEPVPEPVSGIYRNQCCSDIMLRDGRLTHGGKSVEFRVVTLKFGPTGSVDGRITPDDIQPSEEPTPIGFSYEEPHPSLSIRIDQRDYRFQLVRSFAPPG
jgi:hypothetical protein